MLSATQIKLVDKAKALGFGYSLFAENIVKQDYCSIKQEKALKTMISNGEYRRRNWSNRRSTTLDSHYMDGDCEPIFFDDY